MFDILSNFTEFDDTRLAEYLTEAQAAFDELANLDTPTDADLDSAEELGDHIDALHAEQDARSTATAARAERAAALRERFSTEPAEGDAEEEGEEATEEEATEEEGETAEVEAEVIEEVAASTRAPARRVQTLARKVPRPPKPAVNRQPVSITAAADVPEFATGSAIDSMDLVGKAVINRMRGFGQPTGDGSHENLQHYGVATFGLDIPADLTVDRHSDDMEILNRAADEHRLPGGSLVAASGWCAPSETIYDLCPGGSTDGMLSLPEINVARGGIKYTKGPDFSALYSAGFCQTEAQAIAGTTKPCYEVPCPPFVEVRLDACGICVKVPILLNAAYPEVVAATISEAMVAHQHAMNAKILAAVATSLGAAVAFPGLGAASTDTLEALLLASANIRQKYRLPLSSSLEVVLPFWAKDVLLSDMSRRTAGGFGTASEADVNAIFAAANTHVQYVYDWNPLPAAAVAWPATIPALIYPAGAFVVGKSDVINLNAVYDAASLATNIYTGLFFEQGILVAPMCHTGVQVTIPVCNAGRTGSADLVCA